MSNITKELISFSEDQELIEKILLRNNDLDKFFYNKNLNPFIVRRPFVEDDFFNKYIEKYAYVLNAEEYKKEETIEDILSEDLDNKTNHDDDEDEDDDDDVKDKNGDNIIDDDVISSTSSSVFESDNEIEDENKSILIEETSHEVLKDNIRQNKNILTTVFKKNKSNNSKSKYELDCKLVENTINNIELAIKNLSCTTQKKATIIKFCEEKNVKVDIKIFDMIKPNGDKFITDNMIFEWCNAIEINNQKELFDFGSILLDTLFGLLENLSSNKHIVKKLGFNLLEGINDEIKNTNILNSSKLFINQSIEERTGQASIFLELLFLVGNRITKNVFKPKI